MVDVFGAFLRASVTAQVLTIVFALVVLGIVALPLIL